MLRNAKAADFSSVSASACETNTCSINNMGLVGSSYHKRDCLACNGHADVSVNVEDPLGGTGLVEFGSD